MSTERKIRASQQNGAQSHGAVTPEGLLKSSANSARHHLLSKTILLDSERPDAFADLLTGLTSEFNPQTETQRALVETMAVSRWRQMRIWAVERATLQSAMEAHDPDTAEPATRAALAFRSLADDSRTLDLLSRYETRFDRQFARSLTLLRRTGLPACGTPAPHPGPSAEGAYNDFCQTNLIPFPNTQPDAEIEAPEPSLEPPVPLSDNGADLPALGVPAPHPGASAEGAPSQQSDSCQTNLIPQSDTQPDADIEAPDPAGRRPSASQHTVLPQPPPRRLYWT